MSETSTRLALPRIDGEAADAGAALSAEGRDGVSEPTVPLLNAEDNTCDESAQPVQAQVNAQVTGEVTAEVTEDVAAEVIGDSAPEVTPQVTPQATPQVTPQVVGHAAPQVTPEVAPDVAPEVTPEVSPHRESLGVQLGVHEPMAPDPKRAGAVAPTGDRQAMGRADDSRPGAKRAKGDLGREIGKPWSEPLPTAWPWTTLTATYAPCLSPAGMTRIKGAYSLVPRGARGTGQLGEVLG